MKEIYDWVPWFSALSQIVADGEETDFVEKARQVNWGNDGRSFAFLDLNDEEIDPFSFFYTLAKRNTRNFRRTVYSSVSEVFDLMDPPAFDSAEAWTFPTPPANAVALFNWRGESNPSLMWRLFRSARQGLDQVKAADFDDALTVKGVKRKKLTQALCLINPSEFVPYDDTMVPLLPDIEPDPFQFDTYREVLAELRNIFPGCDFHEINLFAYWRKRYLENAERQFYQVSTRVYGYEDQDRWDEFSENNWVRTGGAGGEDRTYPLNGPKAGDIVLVRFGTSGRGIGIVHKNDYGDNYVEKWDDDARIHVVWINKAKGSLETEAKQAYGLSRAFKLVSAFRDCQAYAPTFDVIGDITGESEGPTPAENTFADLAEELFLSVGFLENIETLLESKKQVIFQGPPGTGKTYVAQALAKHLVGSDDRWDLVQFHPSYSYEDFVRGYRPALENGRPTFKLKDGPLLRIARRASEADDELKFILIIDEINRGNLAKVLGELYFLLEYREKAVNLMYQRDEDADDPFRMPSNLYIIGTMNTADRNIALVDLALRRRFAFVDFDPHEEPINGVLGRWMRTRNPGRVEWLVDRVARANEKLKRYGAAAIGPSYFMQEDLDDDGAKRIWKHEVFPYVAEQFFGDTKKAAEFELDALEVSKRTDADGVDGVVTTTDAQVAKANDAGD